MPSRMASVLVALEILKNDLNITDLHKISKILLCNIIDKHMMIGVNLRRFTWLRELTSCTLGEVAYSIDDEGELTSFYSLRKNNESQTFCIIETDSNGLSRCVDVYIRM